MNRIRLIKRLLAQNVSKGKFLKSFRKLRVVSHLGSKISKTVPVLSIHLNYLAAAYEYAQSTYGARNAAIALGLTSASLILSKGKTLFPNDLLYLTSMKTSYF